jgi:hypothetical protein
MLKLLTSILILMTVDELLLKLLDLSPSAFLTARYILDAAYVLISIYVLARRWPSSLLSTRLIGTIFALSGFVLATGILNSDLAVNFDFLFVTFRYIPLGAALATFDRGDVIKRLNFVFRTILYMQLAASIFQVLGVDFVIEALLPPQLEGADVRIATKTSDWDGAIFGTFSETISLAFFLVTYIIYSCTVGNAKITSPIVLLALVLILLTESFAALGLVLAFLAYRALGWVALAAATIVIAILPTTVASLVYINGFGLSEYFEIAETSRVGILLYTIPEYVRDASVSEILFGVGRDPDTIKEIIFSSSFIPEIFLLSKTIAPLEDVFYAALFMYFGLFGTISYVVLYMWNAFSVSEGDKTMRTMLISLTVLFGITSMVNQIMSVQIVSAFYWALSGLAASRLTSAKARARA